jgi:RNA polymerase sigma-70 factor, ECF subfamily
MGSGPDNRVEVLAASLRRGFVAEPSRAELSEDAMLVAAARDGDRVAFGCLYDRYARMVHGVLLAKVPTSEVEDLVQDVFMMALRRLSTVRDTSRFGAWLAAIARNRANDYHRRWGPEDRRPADEILEDAASNVSRGDDDRATEILDAVKSLPDSYRETLILRLVEGMTGPEIAARTGMTHGSVRVNLHRGMQQLRARLRSNRDSDDPERETP